MKRQRRIKLQNDNKEKENRITQLEHILRFEKRMSKQSVFSVSKQAVTKKRLVIRLNIYGSIKNYRNIVFFL